MKAVKEKDIQIKSIQEYHQADNSVKSILMMGG